MNTIQAGTSTYTSLVKKMLLKKSYSQITKYPKVGFPLLRVHCRLRPDFTDADPLKTEWVDPSRITAISNHHPRRSYGVVASGRWDKDCTSIDKLPAYEGVKEYIQDDNEGRLREIFRDHVEEKPGDAWGHSSMATFNKRLDEIDRLYESIKENGYLSQVELLDKKRRKTIRFNNESVAPLLNEITVDIGRSGDLLYCGYGSHRLAVAKILNINEICVRFGARHTKWQQIRNDFRKKKITQQKLEKYRNHPDLRDIKLNQNV